MKRFYTVFSLWVILACVLGACGRSAAPAAPTASQPADNFEPAAPTATQALAEPAKKYVIGVSNSFIGSEWRAQMIKDLEEVARELNVELVIENADTDIEGQIRQIGSLVKRGVDAIIIYPGDQKGLNAALEDAVSAGVIVIAVDQQISAQGVYNVCIDQKEWAMISMKWVADKMGGQGNLTLIEGFVGHPINEDRMAGVAEILQSYPEITIVGRDTGEWNPAIAEKVAANFLASIPNINGMWTQDGMAEGQLRAIKAADPAAWPVASGEASASFLRAWKNTIAQQPGFETIGVINPPGIGADALRIAYLLLNGRVLEPANLSGTFGNALFMPIPGVVTNENLDEWLTKIEARPDSYILDGLIDQAQAESYFLK
jgi:ribose transport system substrate-binding protein